MPKHLLRPCKEHGKKDGDYLLFYTKRCRSTLPHTRRQDSRQSAAWRRRRQSGKQEIGSGCVRHMSSAYSTWRHHFGRLQKSSYLSRFENAFSIPFFWSLFKHTATQALNNKLLTLDYFKIEIGALPYQNGERTPKAIALCVGYEVTERTDMQEYISYLTRPITEGQLSAEGTHRKKSDSERLFL